MNTELRENLAANLRELMAKRFDLDTQVKIRERSKQFTDDGKGLAQATIQRILSCQVHAGIDTLAILAKVFGVSPLALISKSGEIPTVAPAAAMQDSTTTKFSPFAAALAGLYDDLPGDDRLRSRIYHKVTGILLNPDLQPDTPPSAAPAATEKLKTPHE
jgi:hypothetical protein